MVSPENRKFGISAIILLIAENKKETRH